MDETMLFTHEQLHCPCVYIVSNSGSVTYVGVGTRGFGRIFGGGEDDRQAAISDCSEIKLIFHKDAISARQDETRLIHEYHPVGNRFCSLCDFYIKKYPRKVREKGSLFGLCRGKILALLTENPNQAYWGREITRLTNISNGTVTRELRVLVESGIVTRLETDKNVLYQANTMHQVFAELRSMVLKGI